MKRVRLTNQGLGLSVFCMITTTVHAGIPVWSITPIGSPAVTVSATGTATVSYTVTNNSKKPHRLVLSAKTPTGISQTGGPCVLAAKSPTNSNPTCTLTLSINGSALPANSIEGGPSLCQTNPNGTPNANQCYQPDPNDVLVITRTTTPGATTLSTSVAPPSILALSVNNTALNAALTGNARYITIQNTGTNPATGLSVSATGLPTGTNITTVPTTCTGTLAPGATCTVTITPGPNATSSCTTGIAPAPGTITVSATNVAQPATSNVVVLSYGCQYQGGFLYSVDDTTNNGVTGTCTTPPCTKSIGGKVASITDQAAPYIGSGPQATSIIWSSNGSGSSSANVSYDIIPLISEISTSNDFYSNAQSTYNTTYTNGSSFPFPAPGAFATCSGATQGSCNSSNILALYDAYKTGYGIGSAPYTLSAGPTSRTDYAAGLCTATINTYSDWYLPAICEMDSVYGTVTCPAGAQSMVANLSFLLGNPSAATPSTSCTPPSGTHCLAGVYWSSTEDSVIPQSLAWVEYFASSGGSNQGLNYKLVQLGARCSRALTL
ncbi:hypothetical protein [Legionella sp. km772]|uniref:hypothetical protein n=1 Tax=Legionella sp. km772 TaxID=2498111 RepID=UPI000F8F5E9B|nr:hypothetical protein [Legionella sp. km772]RUR08545.1 hypothetical protein ELY15_10605 [Legionella sp. km772]